MFDTWLLNCDRFSFPTRNPPTKPRINRNNVFLSEEAPDGKFVLKAMDHTHCFTCGKNLRGATRLGLGLREFVARLSTLAEEQRP